MSEEEIKSTLKKINLECKTLLVKNPDGSGFQLKLASMDSGCRQTLEEISASLGKYGKRHLAKRIVTENPEVTKALKDSQLTV